MPVGGAWAGALTATSCYPPFNFFGVASCGRTSVSSRLIYRSLTCLAIFGLCLSCSSSSGGGGVPAVDGGGGTGAGGGGGFGNFGNFDGGDAQTDGSGAGGPTCVGSCGLPNPVPGAFCFCNDLCTTQGNCCPDYATVCTGSGGADGGGSGGFGGGTGGFGTGGFGTGGFGTGGFGTGGFGTGGFGATGGSTSACWNTTTCNPGTTCVQNCGACMIQSKKCWTDGTWLPPSACVPGGC